MKKMLFVVLAVMVLAAFVVPVAFAQSDVPGGEIVDPVQLYVIGLVASAVVYGVKLLNTKYPNLKIKREWLTVILYVAALVLAVYWGGVSFPSFPEFNDPVSFVSALLTFFTNVIAALAFPTSFATLIYNVLLKRVFDGAAVKVGWIEA
jgi:hypothetical protein